MKVLLTTTCKPIPMLLDRYLSIDDSSYRFVVDQGVFSVSSENHIYSLHFLAQNIVAPSTVLEWPSVEELEAELRREHYDFVAMSVKVIDLDRVGEVIDVVKRVSPGTKTVVGGFGTLGIEGLRSEGIDVADRADYICHSEGVEFMNRLLGDYRRLPRTSHLPLERIRIPWLPMDNKVGYVLSALGCPVQCEFCATSAYVPGGQVHEVMTVRELYQSIRWYFDTYRDMHQIYVMDENFLAYKKRVNELGTLLRDDRPDGLSRLNMHCFGTIMAISRWEPEELLLNGVGGIWSGVESFYSYDRKKAKDVKALFDGMHEHGIQSILSWIIGDDMQTKDNIDDDINKFVALRPPTSQLSVLTAMPGTKLYDRLKKEGRLLPFTAGEMHLLGNNMKSLHFTHDERVNHLMNTYRRLYETNGTAVMRGLDIDLNGYRTCMKSRFEELQTRKAAYFRKRVTNAIPLVRTAIEMAPNANVRDQMERLRDKYVDLVGPLTKSQQLMADKWLAMAHDYDAKVIKTGGAPVVQPELYRMEYAGVSRDAAALPETQVDHTMSGEAIVPLPVMN